MWEELRASAAATRATQKKLNAGLLKTIFEVYVETFQFAVKCLNSKCVSGREGESLFSVSIDYRTDRKSTFTAQTPVCCLSARCAVSPILVSLCVKSIIKFLFILNNQILYHQMMLMEQFALRVTSASFLKVQRELEPSASSC